MRERGGESEGEKGSAVRVQQCTCSKLTSDHQGSREAPEWRGQRMPSLEMVKVAIQNEFYKIHQMPYLHNSLPS